MMNEGIKRKRKGERQRGREREKERGRQIPCREKKKQKVVDRNKYT